MDLIEHAEGERQDRKAAFVAWYRRQPRKEKRRLLIAGFRKLADRRNQRQPTDLHVKEFLINVLYGDSGTGWQQSHRELCKVLECEPSTVRWVIRRATEEFGLIETTEDRYVSGGQRPNRYRVNAYALAELLVDEWVGSGIPQPESKSEIRPGASESQGGVIHLHPPVSEYGGGVTELHPYKEYNQPSYQPLSNLSPPPQAAAQLTAADSWSVVVRALMELGMSSDGTSLAVQAAQQRGLSIVEAQGLIERFVQLTAANPEAHVGWLHRWLVGKSRPPEPPQARAAATKPSLIAPRDREKFSAELARMKAIRSSRREAIK